MNSFAGGLHSNQLNLLVIQIMKKSACGITASAYACDNRMRIFITRFFFQLPFYFGTDYTLKPGHHIRVWMWANHATDDIMGVCRMIDPVTYRFVGSIF